MMNDDSGLMSGDHTPTSIGTVAGPLDLLAPAPRYLEDLAIPAGRIRRWTGHGVMLPVPLTHHMLHVAQTMRLELGVADPALLLAGLLHDVHEAMCGDVSRPLKLAMRQLCGGPSPFDEVERRCMEAVALRFAPWCELKHPLVMEADCMVLGHEAEVLFGQDTAAEWGLAPAVHGLTGEGDAYAYLRAAALLGCRHVSRHRVV